MNQFRMAALAAQHQRLIGSGGWDVEAFVEAASPTLCAAALAEKEEIPSKNPAARKPPSARSAELMRLGQLWVFDARPKSEGVRQQALRQALRAFRLSPDFVDRIGIEEVGKVVVGTQLLSWSGEKPYLAVSFLYDYRLRRLIVISATLMSTEAAEELRCRPELQACRTEVEAAAKRFLPALRTRRKRGKRRHGRQLSQRRRAA